MLAVLAELGSLNPILIGTADWISRPGIIDPDVTKFLTKELTIEFDRTRMLTNQQRYEQNIRRFAGLPQD